MCFKCAAIAMADEPFPTGNLIHANIYNTGERTLIMATPTLYEIDANMRALDALLEEVDGEVTDQDTELAIDKWLAENADDLSVKLDSYGAVIRNFETRAAGRKIEAERLLGLAATDENNVKRLKERLRLFFNAHKIQKMETAKFKWRVQANGGKAPLVLSEEVNMDPLILPSQYIEEQPVEYKILTDKIRETFAAGTDEEKAELEGLVEIGERGDHLRIS